MQIDEALISKLERLSRLKLEPTERIELQNDLNKILSMIEKLQELDLSDVGPLTYLGNSVNIFRNDEIKGQLPREKALQNAPDTNGPFFKVPKIITHK